MTQFNIKIVSDTICPWCYLGKARLDRAISQYKSIVPDADKDSFNITWHPFYLDPTAPTKGIDAQTHLRKKLGPEHLTAVHNRLKQLGAREGINFSIQGKIGNTRDGHRLVQLAKTKSNEVENATVTELFKSYFERDGDVTSREDIIDAGLRAGLGDKAEIEKWLDEGAGGEEVDREVQDAYRRGIHGVPNFLINGKYQIDGAQEAETFLQSLLRIKKAEAPAAKDSLSEGVSC